MEASEIVVGQLYAVRWYTGAVKRLRATSVNTVTNKVAVEYPGGAPAMYGSPVKAEDVLRPWAQHTALKRAVPDAARMLRQAMAEAGVAAEVGEWVSQGAVHVKLSPESAHALTQLLNSSDTDASALEEIFGE